MSPARKGEISQRRPWRRYAKDHPATLDPGTGLCGTCGGRLNRRKWGVSHDRPRETIDEMFRRRVDTSGAACWEWTGYRNTYGYGVIRSKVAQVFAMAHRYAWEQARGPIPDGLLVLHHCDTPACVKTEPDDQWPEGHLFLGTDADNVHDKVAKGRQPRGRDIPSAKLTDDDVRAIRALLIERSESYRKIGERFGVGWGSIRHIDAGKTWRHVE